MLPGKENSGEEAWLKPGGGGVQWLSRVQPCDPMDCSTPVLHHLPELAQTHVH